MGAPVTTVTIPSPTLGGDVTVRLLLTPGDPVDRRWVWLLHGRGSSAAQSQPLLDVLGSDRHRRLLGPLAVAVVDGPWSDRAGWWVDSRYDGAAWTGRGRPVETALLADVLPAVECSVGTVPDRDHRVVLGVSMGAAAALRWALVHRTRFASAVLLSPAVYAVPPPGSSARTSGAFGTAGRVWDPARWDEVASWPRLLAGRPVAGPRTRVVTIVGDAEPLVDDLHGGPADLSVQAVLLHAALRRRADVDASLRVVAGGHDEEVWERSVVPALRLLDHGDPLDARWSGPCAQGAT